MLLHCPSRNSNQLASIVAVHGLNGHREKTWTASNNVLWLRDLLPQRLNNARVFTWGYDANTHSASRVTAQYLYDHATTLVSDLALERQLTGTQERPIIFVAHNLGGIVVKSVRGVLQSLCFNSNSPARPLFTLILHAPTICHITEPSKHLHMA